MLAGAITTGQHCKDNTNPDKNMSNVTTEKPREVIKPLVEFLPPFQREIIIECCHGEEGAWFISKIHELKQVVETMPVTYETDGQGMKAVAHLHYFAPGCDWYITEKDVGAPGSPGQHQAFGWADLGCGGELGYISIEEIRIAGAELDLHFTPQPLEELV